MGILLPCGGPHQEPRASNPGHTINVEDLVLVVHDTLYLFAALRSLSPKRMRNPDHSGSRIPNSFLLCFG